MERRKAHILRAVILAASVSAVASCATSPPVPPWDSRFGLDNRLVGRIYVPAEHRFIGAEALVERAIAHRYVLLGEKHDNPDHHRLQAWVTDRMIAGGRRPALVMEMIPATRQPDIDAHIRDNPFDARGLGPVLLWNKTGWPAWRYYAPIVQPLLAHRLPVFGANLNASTIRAIARDGFAALGTKRMAEFALDRPLPEGLVDAVGRELVEVHCGRLSVARARSLAPVQIARDAAFAHAMRHASLAGNDGAILIAGAGHVRRDRGVPLHLLRQGARPGESYSIAFLEVEGGRTAPSSYAAMFGARTLPFDAVWFTPRDSNKNPCKELR